MTAPYQSYFRVWAAWPHAEAEHQEFHRTLWAKRSDDGVIRLLLETMEMMVRELQQEWFIIN